MTRLQEQKKKADRKNRVRRTAEQFGIVALVAVYPTLVTISDLDALVAVAPSLAFVALGAIVTDIYNRVKPA